MVKCKINGETVEVSEGTTILEAAKGAGVKIPTLCYNSYLKPYGGCRICLVEITSSQMGGRSKLVSSCTYTIGEGLIVNTESQKVLEGRKFVIELLLARCPEAVEIRSLADEYGITPRDESTLDDIGKYLFHRAPKPEHTKCILCGLCVRVCAEITQRHALALTFRGTKRKVTTPYNRISETCIGCGACAYLCPTNTITVEEAE